MVVKTHTINRRNELRFKSYSKEDSFLERRFFNIWLNRGSNLVIITYREKIEKEKFIYYSGWI